METSFLDDFGDVLGKVATIGTQAYTTYANVEAARADAALSRQLSARSLDYQLASLNAAGAVDPTLATRTAAQLAPGSGLGGGPSAPIVVAGGGQGVSQQTLLIGGALLLVLLLAR